MRFIKWAFALVFITFLAAPAAQAAPPLSALPMGFCGPANASFGQYMATNKAELTEMSEDKMSGKFKTPDGTVYVFDIRPGNPPLVCLSDKYKDS